MRENEKTCAACAYSYTERTGFRLRQKCRSPEYNSQGYTQFDTLEEMLAYHAAMPDLDRHFCKLYDRHAHKFAPGWAVTWSWYDKSDPWRDWT